VAITVAEAQIDILRLGRLWVSTTIVHGATRRAGRDGRVRRARSVEPRKNNCEESCPFGNRERGAIG
jgi:hypothetical protein